VSAVGPVGGRGGRARLAGAVALAALAAAVWLQAPWAEPLRTAWFDTQQRLLPRRVGTLSATVVEIDQRSLATIGQWPWPRTRLAELLRAIDRAKPAAIGVNVLMPEPDALSPERLLANLPGAGPALAAALQALPANDAVLAASVEDARAVLAVAGMPSATGIRLRAVPVAVRPAAAAEPLLRYVGAVASIDELNRRAAGWGLISADPAAGPVRRIPLLASIDGTLVPTLAVELLRVAAGVPALRLEATGGSLSLSIGDLRLPLEPDGQLRVYFSGHLPERFVSAVDVLEGRADPAALHRQLVLVGLTGIGLHEYLETPLGQRLAGVEIQAQLLENLIDGTWLARPAWAPLAEALALLLVGAALLWLTPRARPIAAAAALGSVALLGAASLAAFRSQRWLLDAATPAASLLLLFGLLLVLTLAEATRQRRALQRVVQAQREQAARVAGELEAARQIQNAALPPPERLRGDRRVEVAALLAPAREVGGDLYDYFMLDDRRLFFLIGDVAGKGLSASIFMAVSKALVKSVTLRMPLDGADADGGVGRILRAANAEVARDNAKSLFVTAFAAIVDLDRGELCYCNAGHDNPYLRPPGGAAMARLEDGDGPPLCVVPDFPYEGACRPLQAGSLLVLMTDGVAEARNAAGELYGAERVQRVLRALPAGATAARAVQALRDDVASFVAGAEPADDLTVLALRWLGPAAAAA